MRSAAKIRALEITFARHFLSWRDAYFLAEQLLLACRMHLPASVAEQIAKEFEVILAKHRPKKAGHAHNQNATH